MCFLDHSSCVDSDNQSTISTPTYNYNIELNWILREENAVIHDFLVKRSIYQIKEK